MLQEEIKKDEYYIRFSGVAEIPEPLSSDQDYNVKIERMGFEDWKIKNLQDGKKRITYLLKPLSHAEIISQGKAIKTSDPIKLSVKLRGRLWILANEQGIDEQEFYDRTMQKIILYADEVIEFLENKN
ncbi:MAG: hypothetical protein AAB432_03240 [Patescibacteria group bacterium]